jgi:hypothetical protein
VGKRWQLEKDSINWWHEGWIENCDWKWKSVQYSVFFFFFFFFFFF